jgi:hypothetical protein
MNRDTTHHLKSGTAARTYVIVLDGGVNALEWSLGSDPLLSLAPGGRGDGLTYAYMTILYGGAITRISVRLEGGEGGRYGVKRGSHSPRVEAVHIFDELIRICPSHLDIRTGSLMDRRIAPVSVDLRSIVRISLVQASRIVARFDKSVPRGKRKTNLDVP